MNFSVCGGVTGDASDSLGCGFAVRIGGDVIDVWGESVPALEEEKGNCAGESRGRASGTIFRGVFRGALDV
jgi:hypothetical protein